MPYEYEAEFHVMSNEGASKLLCLLVILVRLFKRD